MDVKKKVFFIVPSMRGGGSERVMSILLTHLDRSKFDVVLILLKKEGRYLEDLPNDLKIIDLNVSHARKAMLKIAKLIREEKPNVVFSTLGYLNILISIIRPFFSKKIKFIGRESSIVSVKNKKEKYPKLFDFLYKFFYSNFDMIISQSYYMKNDLMDNYRIKDNKIKVINNPVDIDKINILSQEIVQEKVQLLAVGRLSYVKNFQVLIKVLVKLPDVELTILGEGKEKENLVDLAKELDVLPRVTFLGFQDNPYKYMKNANLLVLTSHYEGFPNVILEANACGLPVVAFKCPGGTAEIIEEGVNGFLVECGNLKKLSQRIKESLTYKWNKQEVERIINERYEVKTIVASYSKVISETI